MIQRISNLVAQRSCARALIESDRRYFEMAAEVQELSLGRLTWMPGLTGLAASCVIHRVETSVGQDLPATWFDEIEQVLGERAVCRARIYFDGCPRGRDEVFRDRGYERRSEIGYLAPVGHPKVPANMRLSQVLTKDDWKLKLSLHEQAMEAPDGYTNQADLWVEMERRKCATGLMRSFLVRLDDEIVATVGTIVNDGLLRLKNIVVSPHMRRRGTGVGVVQHLWQMAEVDYGCRFGVFGVQGGKGSKLYSRAGLYEVTRQTEWSRLMAAQL
mmetsp:Transcript_25424/g.61239  ORF Transcript_25424/g.61239 Transcript_25424/m.61239 type:complete len:272 (-) Transcript_25424:467-1282(-)